MRGRILNLTLRSLSMLLALMISHQGVVPLHAQEGWRDTSWGAPIPAESWTSLGPAGPATIQSLGVSLAWPTDPFLIGLRRNPDERVEDQRTVRSFDGSKTWEEIRTPIPGSKLAVIRQSTSERVIIALPGDSGVWPQVVSRSTDDGANWSVVASLLPSRTRTRWSPRLIVSPDVAHDSVILLVNDGQLLRSLDVGATWTVVDPAPGQVIQDAIFSPNFAVDQTIFAVATAGDYPSNEPSRLVNIEGTAT